MLLDNFIEIISGKLCNTPCISFIHNITTKVENIKNGDMFIARNKDEIQDAVKRGAYGIVSDTCVEIIDNEIAWILVDDIDNALLKFIKYIQLMNNIEIYYCDDISFKLANNIIKDSQVRFATNVDELLESLFYKNIIINFNISLFEILHLESQKELCFSIIKQTLFEIKMEYDNEIYQIIIPKIFINELNNVIYFCKQKNISLNLNADLSSFLPVFINSYARLSKYGQSMRFIYASKDRKFIKRYIDFVLLAKWGKALFLSTKQTYKHIQTKHYKSKDELMQYFSLNEFHFFVVFGISQSELKEVIADNATELSLF
ncbi:hypothetical protein CCY99_05805 [Helicobacter sp. 16-1353]|uniref:hypothetical protein n=1 Tax=Helicobacter sp. 16-1353 TaxID=2004996 RepID=UPI000DCC74DF|nr:hypothetical protein [Helicobacter sp. 16-1353]RAX53893.1 hypothetical protein CCY99_05805 [Helicobacter sp. 16-1353]